jgi:four helix bundle protein
MMRDESRANELEDRLIDFAVRVIKVANSLPRNPVGRHLAEQLLRSGTSPAPNYAEARGAESRADFAHKLKIAVKELNETRVWLRMVCRAELVKSSLLQTLIVENDELCRILNSSVTTVRQQVSKPNHK